MQSEAPTPEVQYLPTLFRKIETGDIRIPAFQRQFVWSQAQIIQLLESVYKGYPIGSLLFWKVDESTLRIANDAEMSFPDVIEKYPMSFVLDGMQRLSALYGVFKNANVRSEDFDIVFNLNTKQFYHFSEITLFDGEHIRLSNLFSPRQLIQEQQRLGALEDSTELLNESVTLHSVFQEYLIPTVTIRNREVNEVVEIFERINSTGTKLSTLDFMRALTWSDTFDLNRQIESIRESCARLDFLISEETILKCIAIALNRLPMPQDMMGLRELKPNQLQVGTETAKEALHTTISYLKDSIGIINYEFVPYEGQLLVLVAFFSRLIDSGKDQNGVDPRVVESLTKWFWSIGISEGLRGKPDHYVARYVETARKSADDNEALLLFKPRFSAQDFADRRLIGGGALSSMVVSMFAANSARSIYDGNIIDSKLFLESFSARDFEAIISKDELQNAKIELKGGSAKILANIILEPHVATDNYDEFIDALDACDENVQLSQFLNDRLIELLFERKFVDFLTERSQIMYEFAMSLCE